MSLSRINLSAAAQHAAASKLPAFRWRRICASPHWSPRTTYLICKRWFGTRFHKAASDRSPSALQA